MESPRNLIKKKRDCLSIVHNDKIRDCEPERLSVQARNENAEDRELKGV